MCELFGVSKQAYYKINEQKIAEKAAQVAFAVEFIRYVREYDHGIGGLKLWYMYRSEFAGNAPLGRDRFEDIIYKYGLKVRNKVRKPKTTDSSHGLPTFPNIIKDFIPTIANQLWVSDITYIEMWENEMGHTFCYLSLILDAYSEEIVGYCVGPSLETIYPIAALKMALRRLQKGHHNLIHHSDRGIQYASSEYVKILKSNGIAISMTETGDPKDNAQAERINNTIKNEMFKDVIFHNLDEVRTSVARAVDFYNNKRPHMSINMMTPSQASLCTGEITKKWHSWREDAIKSKHESEITENSLPLPCG
ncbi:MAG: IS3 family transposase [Bacteroidales bacterium]|nr:IS3 family transposase [Bacteroidales bacterium]